jgi:hypothetical protein
MRDSRQLAQLHAALRFVVTSNITAEHKPILIDVLTQALRDVETAELNRQAIARAGAEWQESEVTQLSELIRDRVATSWQQADECMMHLAAQLHRDPHSIRDKATQLGLGAAVDYRLAKALKQAHGE